MIFENKEFMNNNPRDIINLLTGKQSQKINHKYTFKVNNGHKVIDCWVMVTQGKGKNSGKFYGRFAFLHPLRLVSQETKEVLSESMEYVIYRGNLNSPIKDYKEI
jgi:hypothetical protein